MNDCFLPQLHEEKQLEPRIDKVRGIKQNTG